MTNKLEGRVALITGGSQGIGAAIARRFAAEGASIAVADIQGAGALLAELRGSGVAATHVLMDVTDPIQVREGFAAASADLGPVDLLVNNAAIGTPVSSIDDMIFEEWERAIRINLTGTMLCTQAAAVTMRAQGRGNIVNIASNVARRGLPNRSAYVASKWAVLGFTQTAALEYVDAGIRVNAVLPGPVATPHLDEVMQAHARIEGRSVEEVAEDWRTGSPMRRFIELDEIASVSLFLASADSSAMTGQALNVTGGMIMT
jgi:NAD(P)-dependent dehydrogenase (short-subunit alcohol dehydrogenase family)